MKHLLLTISLFALVTCFVTKAKALTIEEQLKPYPELKNYKAKDIMDLINVEPIYVENLAEFCNKKLHYLSGLFICVYREEHIPSYILVSIVDSTRWQILQKLSNGILINAPYSKESPIVMIEGEFNVFDGQPFSKKHYLLKYDGTFKYTNALGSNKTVPKLKLLTEIKTN